MTVLRILIAVALVVASIEIVQAFRSPVATHVACASDRSDALHVLFIGNSHTFVNDLPAAVCGLGRASSPPVVLDVTEVVAGGYTLADHLEDGSAARVIAAGRWDWVVLQEQSLLPAMDPARYVASLRAFEGPIHAAHARMALFALPPRKDRQQDPATVERAYASAAAELGATLVPVGSAWRLAANARPDVDLYQRDGYHPRPEGTYVGACVFFALLTGRTPEGLPPRTARITLAPDLAKDLQHAAAVATK